MPPIDKPIDKALHEAWFGGFARRPAAYKLVQYIDEFSTPLT